MYVHFRESKFFRREQKGVILHLPNVTRMICLLTWSFFPVWTSKLRAAILVLTRKTWSEINGIGDGLCGLNCTKYV